MLSAGRYNSLLMFICWSPRLAGSLIIFVADSVCPFVILLQIASSFLFVDGMEPFFCPSVLRVALYKTYSYIFDLGPLTPKIYSTIFAQNRL